MLPLRAAWIALIALIASAACACGGADDAPGSGDSPAPRTDLGPAPNDTVAGTGGHDAIGGGGAGFTPAVHPPMPRMVSSGGAVLAAPKVVAMFASGDPLQAQLVDFVSTIGATDYWRAVTAEYGVAPLAASSAVVLDQTWPAAMSTTAVEQVIAKAIASGIVPAPNENALYMLFTPQTTSIASGPDKSCATFGGYHYEGRTPAGQAFAYAVVPRCATFNGLTGLDMVTVAASHELVEASTDPWVLSGPAYKAPDLNHVTWGLVFTSEAGDMCAQNPGVAVTLPGFPYRVQRSWSNVAAAASHDPCAPALPGEVYFNAAPALDDVIAVSDGKTSVPTLGVKMATGDTRTIDVALYSDAPSAPWTVTPIDLVQLETGTPLLEFTQSATQGANGDHIQLSIKLVGLDAKLGAAPFVLKSTLGERTSFWVGAVAN